MGWSFYLGLTSAGKWPYLLESGIGSIIERLVELLVIGGLLWHRNNCHKPGCPWIGKFPAVEGGGWRYCRKHHSANGVHV